MDSIEEFMKFNLADYDTELTFEKHQIGILLFEYGKHQQSKIEALEKEVEELRKDKLYHLGDFTGEEIAEHLIKVYDKVIIQPNN